MTYVNFRKYFDNSKIVRYFRFETWSNHNFLYLFLDPVRLKNPEFKKIIYNIECDRDPYGSNAISL